MQLSWSAYSCSASLLANKRDGELKANYQIELPFYTTAKSAIVATIMKK